MKLKTTNLLKKNTLDDYLNAAIGAARWIQSLEVKEKVGKTWKIFPDGQNGYKDNPFVGKTSFYAGSAGIGFFFLRLYQVTSDEQWLDEAKAAAEYILANPRGLEFYHKVQKRIATTKKNSAPECNAAGPVNGWSFSYKVGPISEGQFVYALYRETNENRYYEFAIRTANTFVEAAIEDENGLHWSDFRDIVGDAGGIVYLLQVYKDTRKKIYLETAKKAGAYIEKFGRPAKNGGTYYNLYDLESVGEGEKGAVHVNFSHGSAGTAYLWAALYEATKDKRYLKLADDVIKYLEGIAVGDKTSVLFPYQDHPEKGPLDKFYLGMCGGPIGASLPFKKLYELTHDEKYLQWVKRLYAGLVKAGVPEIKSWGYWGSKCICCGGPGALEYFATLYKTYGDAQYLKLAHRSADVLLGESFEEETGLSWYGAWDRVNPSRVVSYTGFYIGAAGVAGSLLKLIAAEKHIQIAEFFEYYL